MGGEGFGGELTTTAGSNEEDEDESRGSGRGSEGGAGGGGNECTSGSELFNGTPAPESVCFGEPAGNEGSTKRVGELENKNKKNKKKDQAVSNHIS